MHIISAADFPLFCSNSARKCLIMPAECSPQKSLIMLEILPAEFIQAYCARNSLRDVMPRHALSARAVEEIWRFIIQQIVTMPIYGKEALNICHLYMTDILRYT